MIEFPPRPRPSGATPALVDFGGLIRGGMGGSSMRINRLGSRFRVAFTFPPMEKEVGRVFVARLIRAQFEGIRLPFPLGGVSQGIPGAPVVDGAGAAGSSLPVRGLTPHYAAKEGFWLSIVKNGQHYLHSVAGQTIADANGKAVLAVSPLLRTAFPDGAAVHLAKPMIEGFVDGDERAWRLSVENHRQIEFVIEEAA